MEPMAFLRQHHPFSELNHEQLGAIAGALQIVHLPAGQAILVEGGEPADAVGVVRKGELELVTGDVVIDLLESGELFGLISVLSAQPPSMTVRAVEDTLCYLVPAAVARAVLGDETTLASVWAIARQRVRAADAVARAVQGADRRFARIGALVRRAPVTIDPNATVADAAMRMRDERVSCLLIDRPDGWAIVTDRDLRSRVLAERGSPDRPIGQIATHPVRTGDADTLAGDAMLQMLEHDIHHLPVAEHGRVVGVITDTDLMDLDRGSPFAIKRAIARAPSTGEVVFAARGFPVVVAGMVEAGADPIDVGRVISLIADGATQRLLALAIQVLGEAPCDYGWLALGSAARHERSIHSDQDHALALGPGFEPVRHDAYFDALAQFVTSAMESIGFARCRANAMAVHPSMRRALSAWVEAFQRSIEDHDEQALVLSSIGFDFRCVAGALDAEPALDAAVTRARANPAFLRRFARVALRHEPPTGFIRGFVVESKGEHAGTLNIKDGGITIITSIARALAIAAGSPAKDTLSRLDAAAGGDSLSTEAASDLAEAFRFLLDLRLRHQVAQMRAGVALNDGVDPATLGPIERSGLRQAFRVIRAEQQALALELGRYAG